MDLDVADPAGPELVRAIRAGDLAALQGLLDRDPRVAAARLLVAGGRTPLHVVADWPGYFPHGAAVVRMLIAAGADPDTRGGGRTPETPLHWAASSDDLDVADALMDGGADLEAPGGSIGTPLDNAVGYGCWHVARGLVARGATVAKLWHAAALGHTAAVEAMLAATPAPSHEELTNAFWQACHGGQVRTADLLLASGADPHAAPDYAQDSSLAAVAAGPDTRRQQLLRWLAEHDLNAG